MSHKVILADTHSVFRAGVARILTIEDDFRIVAQCDDAARLFRAIESFPGATSLFAAPLLPELTLFLKETEMCGSHTAVILENAEDPAPYQKQGVNGVIYRDVSHADLIRCLRLAGRGETFTQRRSGASAEKIENDLIGARTRDRLTRKELAIIGLILQGYKNKDIAIELNNSEQVIKNYLRSIFDKTGVSDRLELALFAIHHQILAAAAKDEGLRHKRQDAGITLPG